MVEIPSELHCRVSIEMEETHEKVLEVKCHCVHFAKMEETHEKVVKCHCVLLAGDQLTVK